MCCKGKVADMNVSTRTKLTFAKYVLAAAVVSAMGQSVSHAQDGRAPSENRAERLSAEKQASEARVARLRSEKAASEARVAKLRSEKEVSELRIQKEASQKHISDLRAEKLASEARMRRQSQHR